MRAPAVEPTYFSKQTPPVKYTDPDQEGVEWLPLQQLTTYRFYPQALISSLIELEQGTLSSVPLYVGDIN